MFSNVVISPLSIPSTLRNVRQSLSGMKRSVHEINDGNVINPFSKNEDPVAVPSPSKKQALDTSTNTCSTASNSTHEASRKTSPSISSSTNINQHLPNMSKDEAYNLILSLDKPVLPKQQTYYMQFKKRLLKTAKDQKDTETIRNITQVARSSWAIVEDARKGKSTKTDDHDKENVSNNYDEKHNVKDTSYLLSIYKEIVDADTRESAIYRKKYVNTRSQFFDAAVAYLQWKIIDCSQDSNDGELLDFYCSSLSEAITRVQDRALTVWCTPDNHKIPPALSFSKFPRHYTSALGDAKSKLKVIQGEHIFYSLVKSLRDASNDTLLDHARRHLEALNQVEKYKQMKAKMEAEKKLIAQTKAEAAQAQAKAKAKQEKKDEVDGRALKRQLIRSLKDQMVYTDSDLKTCRRQIRYTQLNVTRSVFEKAFDVKYDGTKRVVLADWQVGCKPLRYRGYLSCSDVIVDFKGDSVHATASYGIE